MNAEKNEKCVATIGSFDGVHHGHKSIVENLIAQAQKSLLQSVVITFEPHPRTILFPNEEPIRLLNTPEEKEQLLRKIGVQMVETIPFTKEFSELSPEKFVEEFLLKQLNVKKLVIGYDHKFGKDRKGDFAFLKKYEEKGLLEVIEIPAETENDIVVSSTKIRNALLAGAIKMANKLLGYRYKLKGKVVHGDKIGRELGSPTANLQLDYAQKLIPKDGIYAVFVHIESQVFEGVLYIGTRPTLNKTDTVLEVNLFDFEGNIYDKSIEVELIEYIREDKKFDTLDALMHQIQADIQKAKDILNQQFTLTHV